MRWNFEPGSSGSHNGQSTQWCTYSETVDIVTLAITITHSTHLPGSLFNSSSCHPLFVEWFLSLLLFLSACRSLLGKSSLLLFLFSVFLTHTNQIQIFHVHTPKPTASHDAEQVTNLTLQLESQLICVRVKANWLVPLLPSHFLPLVQFPDILLAYFILFCFIYLLLSPFFLTQPKRY